MSDATLGRIVLEVKGLKKYFPIEAGFLRRVVGHLKAVDDVDLTIYEGEAFGLVGESGCGKTTLGRCILRAIEPTEGTVKLRTGDDTVVDVTTLEKRELRKVRRHAQMIFQDPYSSLDPRMTVLDIVGEALLRNHIARGKELEGIVKELIAKVGLDPTHVRRYPHAFSGGQRQRIGIARALAPSPRFIVADEPVSALDVSVQAQVLNLLSDLQREFQLTYLFISHDLSVVRHISDRVGVMYIGRMVELSKAEELFARPLHPYTEALLSALPKPDPDLRDDTIVLPGEVPDPAHPPSGCHFHPRCRYAVEVCRTQSPEPVELSPGRVVACHRAGELTLAGVE